MKHYRRTIEAWSALIEEAKRKKLGAQWIIVGEGGRAASTHWLVLYLVSPDTSSRWEPALTPECRQLLSLDDVKVFLIGPLHPAQRVAHH
jgi:hypothetical protein